ncbi:hypothetical protein LguiB_005341 [Lonicera macranthoides]
MSSKPGLLTDSPWKKLGNFKYVILAPWMVHSVYSWVAKGEEERDIFNFLIAPFLVLRMLHSQLWITISRHRSAKGNNRIVDKSIEFEQVDKESHWDDSILLNGIVFYIFNMTVAGASNLPLWRTDGIIITILLHSGPVEFLYYWLHKALHHNYLYSRYHSHHHSSIATEPISSVVHPFLELGAYFVLFAIPMVTTFLTNTASLVGIFGYVTYIDFMNMMGHCNFEMVPNKLFSIFPPLKFLMYTPTFHSLHHTQFRTNYSLFMPFYDYVYGTTDESTDTLHEASLKRLEDSPDVVHLTHLTTLDSMYHQRLGFLSVSSKPHMSKWKDINHLIEEAILDAEARGTKGEELNRNGEVYIKRYPKLKVKVVDGSSLAAAIVINTIPKGTKQVLLRGKISKTSCAIAFALCQRGIQVATPNEEEYKKIKLISTKSESNSLIISRSYDQKVWLVGEGLEEEEQDKAAKGTIFIPFSTFPPKKIRNDCFYHYTPAMLTPLNLKNMHTCENWLPRRVMSASRVAGIVHALEGWEEHECGDTIFNLDKVWQATLKHGFQPLDYGRQMV